MYLNNKVLKEFLDGLYLKYRNKYSSDDPVWILHRFCDERDIETAGLIVSCYAYGQVPLINKFISNFFNSIDFKVYEFTSNFSQQKDKKFLNRFCYRFNSGEDLALLFRNMQRIISKYGSLKNYFLLNYCHEHENVLFALTAFSDELNKFSGKSPGYGYLIPRVQNNSACKRLNLYLRWMVRKDDIDFGIWNNVGKSKLIMPVDTHVFRVVSNLKMVKRKTCDMRFALELTEKLKQFDKDDPVKYDFALCHLGIDGKLNSKLPEVQSAISH